MFYSISYRVEYEFNKWIKIANMAVIFMYAIFFAYALFNHMDPRQYELGYLTIFIISTLLVLNVILTLNPIYREEGVDSYSRSCCSSQNLMMTISCIFCFQIMEIHHFLAATPEQKAVFYKPFHTLIIFWLIGLWVSIQKLPERFLPEAPYVHKYMSSDILKGAVVVGALVCLNLLLRDTMVLAEADR